MWEILIFKWFSTIENSNKIPKTRFWKENSVEDVVMSPKKRGCKIKQHPDLLYGSKQRCNVWASGTKHNHWSFPSYVVSEYSCMHSLINSQTQLLRIQIGRTELQKPTLTSRIQKLPESTSFLTPKYSSKFRLLLRSSPSYVHHHLLGQVAGVAENFNNQPSPLKTELYTLHS